MTVIYVSGLDGCGKTTQAQLLVRRLQEKGLSAEYRWLRWEPSLAPLINTVNGLVSHRHRGLRGDDTERIRLENRTHSTWSQAKRGLLSSAIFRGAWLRYAAYDYRRAYRRARRSWKSEIIVLDRYLYDFLVDQSLNLGITPNQLLAGRLRSILRSISTPDLGIVIDVTPQLGYERKRDGTSIEYLVKREPLYRNFDAASHVLHVDGAQDPQAVSDQIFSWVEKLCQPQP